MDTDRGLQEVVSRNVRVLMAVHTITHQKELAARLDWGADKLTRSLNGSRKWSLEDLPAIARVFGVTPAALLSDTAELVGATHPAASGSGPLNERPRLRYRNDDSDRITAGGKQTLPGFSGGTIIPFPHRPLAVAGDLTQSARVITLGRHRHLRTQAPSSDTSQARVTDVTAVGGS